MITLIMDRDEVGRCSLCLCTGEIRITEPRSKQIYPARRTKEKFLPAEISLLREKREKLSKVYLVNFSQIYRSDRSLSSPAVSTRRKFRSIYLN